MTTIIIFELNHILDGFLIFREFQMDKIKHLESIFNQFIQFGITLSRVLPTQFQEIKENYQN